MDVSASGDAAIVRCSTIDDAYHTVAAAGTLGATWTSTGGDFPAGEMYVLGMKVA
ncbi:MAG: hypothetical protein R3320_12025 [Nitriliruptorales bacterium]|nr:hypothetical protein [Nitriliruptorales bacterium]